MNSNQEEVSQQEQGIKKVPLSERGLAKFSGFKDREYYPNLEDLAYVLATQQHEYSQVMRRAMKKSRVKEGILNLTKGNEIDKTNDLVLDVKDKIDYLYVGLGIGIYVPIYDYLHTRFGIAHQIALK